MNQRPIVKKPEHKNPILYVTRDIERALGMDPSPDFLIVTNEDSYSRGVAQKFPGHILLIPSAAPLDTIDLLENPMTAAFVGKKFGQVTAGKNNAAAKPNVLVFKITPRIEEFCHSKNWNLLNPSAALAEKIENKITQVEWLGELASLLPDFKLTPASQIVWQKKPLVIQFAHAHTGQGTILINTEPELLAVQKQFPDRPTKVSDYVHGATFTINIAVSDEKTLIGNPSYQITGAQPLTDVPFATVGNDWSLPHSILSETQLAELRAIALKIVQKMSSAGWQGLFGIDVIHDIERDQMKLIEINARQPASTSFESRLQADFRAKGIAGATIFEAHLAAISTFPTDFPEKIIEINDGAQIIQRVTKKILGAGMLLESDWQERLALLRSEGCTAIPYRNSKPNSDLLRIQSKLGLMLGHGKWNGRGHKICDILES
jgi:hypothetical protein